MKVIKNYTGFKQYELVITIENHTNEEILKQILHDANEGCEDGSLQGDVIFAIVNAINGD